MRLLHGSHGTVSWRTWPPSNNSQNTVVLSHGLQQGKQFVCTLPGQQVASPFSSFTGKIEEGSIESMKMGKLQPEKCLAERKHPESCGSRGTVCALVLRSSCSERRSLRVLCACCFLQIALRKFCAQDSLCKLLFISALRKCLAQVAASKCSLQVALRR